MSSLLRFSTASTVCFAFLAAVAAAGCDNHSVIGQQSGHGGTGGGGTAGSSQGGAQGDAGSSQGGGPGDAGTTGTGGSWLGGFGGDFLSGSAGASGVAGSGIAGTFGHGGIFGQGGFGQGGNVGVGGMADGCPQQPGGSGGSAVAFTSVAQYPTYRYPQVVALGDLDGDGKLDFAASNLSAFDQGNNGGSGGGADMTGVGGNLGAGGTPGAGGMPWGGSLSVFLSGENHAAPHHYLAGALPLAPAIGDLNGDGKADLATVTSGGVSVLFNDGGGNLRPPVSFSTGTSPVSVALGDVNGDGKTDMVVANRGNSATGTVIDADVAVLLNMGSGTFVAANYPAGTSPIAVALGDLNGDGKPDIAVASGASVSVLLNGASGTFGAPSSYGAGTRPASVAIGDLNGDGKPDIAVSNPQIGGASVLLNVGNGTFAAAINYAYRSSNGYAVSLAIGDLNGDGKPDLAGIGSDCGIAVLLNAGGGTFGPALSLFAGPSPNSLAIGDTNGDGKLDIVVTNADAVGVLQNLR
jgi:FG-GAP-like repeat